MILIDLPLCDAKQPGHTRGEDYAVCNGNPNKFKMTKRDEYQSADHQSQNFQTGLNSRQPL